MAVILGKFTLQHMDRLFASDGVDVEKAMTVAREQLREARR